MFSQLNIFIARSFVFKFLHRWYKDSRTKVAPMYFPLLRYLCGSNRNKEVQLCMELLILSTVDLRLSKALFSLDPYNQQLHCCLGLGSLFCCSLKTVQVPPPSPPAHNQPHLCLMTALSYHWSHRATTHSSAEREITFLSGSM